MPTQKQILASIDNRLGEILAHVKPPVVVPPVETAPVPVPSPSVPTPEPAPQPAGDKRLAPFDSANVVYSETYKPVTQTYSYKPGAWVEVGLQADMRGGGERPEIGLESDATAEWLMGGSIANALAQAQATRTLPIFRTIDGRFIDVIKYPRASFDARENPDPYFDLANPQGITLDLAHLSCLPNYALYLKTGEVAYLENLQATATYALACGPNNYTGGKGIIYPWQQRTLAWGLREIIKAYIATPEGAVPPPLLPKSYWKQIVENNIAWLTERYINSSDPLTQSLGAFTEDQLSLWQQDYISQVLGWAVYTGQVPQIKPLYDFQIRQAIIRATGPLRSQAIQYGTKFAGAKTWEEVLKLNGKTATADGNYDPQLSREAPHYPGLIRAALKFAVLNKTPGADEAFAYADAQARRVGLVCPRHAV
jgi:hypothetical protein